jgi:predicted AlkP superfamily phosphohydrolase/phosphomutase
MLCYIGPGGGFAILVSLFALFVSTVVSFLALLLYPLRRLLRWFRQKRPEGEVRFRRVIVLGMDGLDPEVLQHFLQQEELPSFKRLASRGIFSRLGTTLPAVSPVAWATFQTGVNPGKHRIFDFLRRDPATYMPALASMEIREGTPGPHIGRRFRRSPFAVLRRGAVPFWEILSEYGIFSQVLNVPSTFPPRPFFGCLLAGMDVPDLRGTQGTFQQFLENLSSPTSLVGGERFPVLRCEGAKETRFRGKIRGPEHPFGSDRPPLELEWSLTLQGRSLATIQLGNRTHPLTLAEWSEWIPIRFPVFPGSNVHGMCRMLLRSTSPLDLYVSPIHIDPRRPALPISHPLLFSVHLSHWVGRFPTLGTAEDHWALNHGILSLDQFRNEATENHHQRTALFEAALARTDRGVLTMVFDYPDRMQHAFYQDPPEKVPGGMKPDPGEKPLLEVYRELDKRLEHVLEVTGEESLVLVVSDHGFGSFRRAVDLNAWLEQKGYLIREDGSTSPNRIPFMGVDWGRTCAYALGMGGIFINRVGRESRGTVSTGAEHESLCEDLIRDLKDLVDPTDNSPVVHHVHRSSDRYQGPYVEEAPDLIVGFQRGFRCEWGSVAGHLSGVVFHTNELSWQADHAFDPSLVPGVLLSNVPLRCDNPHLVDLAPTILDAMGIDTPSHMDGTSLLSPRESSS